jgi:methionyl-tRNA synthetase
MVILEIMIKNGYIVKEEHGVLNSCPKCETIIMKAKCTECGSDTVSPNRKMIHSTCGHINDYLEFITEKGLRCPSCGQVHADSQEINYEKEFKFCDILNQCDDCGADYKHYKMENSHSCPKCNKKSKIKNMNMHHFLVFSNFE